MHNLCISQKPQRDYTSQCISRQCTSLVIDRIHKTQTMLRGKKGKPEKQPAKQILSWFIFVQSKFRTMFYSLFHQYKSTPPLNPYPKKLELLCFIYVTERRSWTSLIRRYISVELLIHLGAGQWISWIKFTEAKRILQWLWPRPMSWFWLG